MNELLAVGRALSDASRVRVLGALGGGELCVCQLVELLGLAPSTVSKHLALLRHAGLVEVRKDGRWAHYRLAGERAGETVRRALALVADALAEDRERAADAARLREILALDPEELCSRQRAQAAACVPAARGGA